MKTLKVRKMDVDDFIRDDKSAAVFLNEMIKLDSGDGSMVRLEMCIRDRNWTILIQDGSK